MTTLFEYPKSAAFGRVLPKSKIYEHGSPGSAVKELFVRQVDQIVWQYKLAPETINVIGTRSVPEIQIFGIALKLGDLKTDVLRCIDEAIPFPILFELRYEGNVKSIAAYKKPGETDGAKWAISDYFETAWMRSDRVRSPLPMVQNLENLYLRLLDPLIPFPGLPGETISERVGRMELIRTAQREISKCERRLHAEKQFNRKVEINGELRSLKEKIERHKG